MSDYLVFPLKVLLGLVLIFATVYFLRALAYAYIYIMTAMRYERASLVARKLFPKMAREVDEAREAMSLETLSQTDEFFRGGLGVTLPKLVKLILIGAITSLALVGAAWLLK